MKPTVFIRTLTNDMYTPHRRLLEWQQVGRACYLPGTHGVFKLALWSGGTFGTVAGLEGTYTSNEGAKDEVIFEFADLLVHDVSKAGNPKLCDERPVYAWSSGGSNDIEWYNAPPRDLRQLHDAIVTWVLTWTKRKP